MNRYSIRLQRHYLFHFRATLYMTNERGHEYRIGRCVSGSPENAKSDAVRMMRRHQIENARNTR